MEVSELTDDELRERLVDFGIPVSDVPISSKFYFIIKYLILKNSIDTFAVNP